MTVPMEFRCSNCNRGYLAMPDGRECFTKTCHGTVYLVGAPPDGDRDGETYFREFDYERLNKQQRRVYDVMKDGQWHSLVEIAQRTGDPEASISARLRDLRKARFGSLTVRRDRRGRADAGMWVYRIESVEEKTDAHEQQG